MIKRGDTRGQFYLAAAIIIVAAIVGFSVATNYLQKENSPNLEELRDELTIEMQKIYDSGVSGELTETEINSNLEEFAEDYSDLTDLDTDFYFVFGDEDDVTVSGYQETQEEESVEITALEGEDSLELDKRVYNKKSGFKPNAEKKIKVKVKDVETDFEIKKGRNFHFVIYYESKGEKHIIRK